MDPLSLSLLDGVPLSRGSPEQPSGDRTDVVHGFANWKAELHAARRVDRIERLRPGFAPRAVRNGAENRAKIASIESRKVVTAGAGSLRTECKAIKSF